MRALQGQVSRLRDRVVSAVTGRPTPADGPAGRAGEQRRAAAAGRGRPRRRAHGHGLALAAGRGGAAGRRRARARAGRRRTSPRPPRRRCATGRARSSTWSASEGADKRSPARVLSWGVNGAGAVVMVAVFAQTGGLTGGEIAVAGGTTAVGQRVLEAVFGDAAVRSLAARAREDLEARADELLRYEQDRFDALRRRRRAGAGRGRRPARRRRRAGRGPPGRRHEPPGAAAGRPAGGAAGGRRGGRGAARGARGGRRPARCWPRPAPGPRSGDATVVALAGRHRQREVDAVQRAVRRRGEHCRASAGPPPASRTPPSWGAGATAPTGCSTGWRCRAGTGTQPEPALDGLVLLDLPDHDSVRLEHRLEVDRLVGLVDVLVWVLDPEKYADAAVHDRYLAPLAGHAGVLLVVLNQVDRLDAVAAKECLTDLRALLDREGLAATPLLARLGPHRHRGRRAARRAGPPGGGPAGGHRPADRRRPRRRGRARRALPGGRRRGAGPPGRRRSWSSDLGDALADAAGVPAVTAAVERSTLRAGVARTGWPLVRWTRKLRPDPLKRLHLGDERARTSLPPAGRGRAGRGGHGGPAGPRRRRARGCRRPGGTTCGAPSRCRRRGWPTGWTGSSPAPTSGPTACRCGSGPSAACSGCWPLVALAGALWLLALVVLGFFQLDDVVPLPRVEGLPLPTLLRRSAACWPGSCSPSSPGPLVAAAGAAARAGGGPAAAGGRRRGGRGGGARRRWPSVREDAARFRAPRP